MVTANLISYLDPLVYSGGGELIVRELLEGAQPNGFMVKRWARRTGRISKLLAPPKNLYPDPQVWILTDVFNCPGDRIRIQDEFLRFIIEKKRYIHIDNAYVDVCSRDYLPCSGFSQGCGSDCVSDLRRKLYKNASQLYFLSPAHRKTILGLLGEDFEYKSKIISPTINTKLFFNHHTKRDIENLYVGTIANYKGYQSIKERYSWDKNFHFIGANSTGEEIFGVHIPRVCHHNLPQFYNRARHFVHLPEWKEPMGRAVVEAALCGCNLITNSNVGACSFNFDLGDPMNYEGSVRRFWSDIYTLING